MSDDKQGRRSSERRDSESPFDGTDRRKAERRSGEDRRKTERSDKTSR